MAALSGPTSIFRRLHICDLRNIRAKAETGDREAEYQLDVWYCKSDGVRKDFTGYRKAAEQTPSNSSVETVYHTKLTIWPKEVCPLGPKRTFICQEGHACVFHDETWITLGGSLHRCDLYAQSGNQRTTAIDAVGFVEARGARQTMRVVKDVINESQCLALARGFSGAQPGDYVQILNIFYECESNPKAALKIHEKSSKAAPPYQEEDPHPFARFTWLAWGRGKPVQPDLLQKLSFPNPFFFDSPKTASGRHGSLRTANGATICRSSFTGPWLS